MPETEIDRFTAEDDEGRAYTIIVYQQVIDAGNMGNPGKRMPGIRRMVTASGMPVMPGHEPGTFHIGGIDKIVR